MSHTCEGMKYALANHLIEPRIAFAMYGETKINQLRVVGYTLGNGKKKIAPILLMFCPFCGLSLEEEKEKVQ